LRDRSRFWKISTFDDGTFDDGTFDDGTFDDGTLDNGIPRQSTPMRHLSDKALARLRNGTELPDLSGTRYRLIEQVARGGMGVVYAAEDQFLQRRVALKVIEEVLEVPANEGDLANRLLREARVLARLEHPGIVPVHDAGTLADGRVFYAMKFVEGQRLDRYIESLASIPDRLRIFMSICDAVAFAHAHGVLHRDLKPANVMVGPFGEVLVMDWGLAKILADALEPAPRIREQPNAAIRDDSAQRENADATRAAAIPTATNSSNTGHGSVLGTPGYMSPEQARGEINLLDARSDIFSLGALLRYLLTEKRPAGSLSRAGSSTRTSLTRIDRSLEAICAKACAPAREARYATVPELTADISSYLNGLPIAAHRESIFERAARFYRRYRFFILLIAAYLLMRVLFIVMIKH
jgi:eukaryotic-like serine/threonine-protein kinase